jgi:hypothetical protein
MHSYNTKYIMCMFGFNYGAVIINSRQVKLVMTCLISQK